MDTSELVLNAKQGNLDAFNELVLKYQDQVFNHACWLLKNQDIAEDITQEAFILVFRKLHQSRGGSFRAWLLKIVTNLCYSEMRTWKRNAFLLWEPINMEGEVNEFPQWKKDTRSLPEDEIEANDLRRMLECALNKLPDNFRTALVLVDINELDYAEAATVMGVPIGTIKSRVARGREQLCRILKEMDTIDTSKQKLVNRSTPAFLTSQSKY